jgi:O-antigen/teichoic acid export membrane protein
LSNLRNKASVAMAWDLIGSYGGQLTSFVITIFLSRLLTPEDFGLVGMSMVFINVLMVFADMGFASALIQSKENSSLAYSSVFFLNVAAGLTISILLFVTAPLIGRFYDNEIIVNLIRLFSISFFIFSFNIVQQAILQKELNFKSLTIRRMSAQIIAGVVAIFFAYRGFGVYALVIQNILAGVITSVVLWRVSGWHPKWEFSWLEVKKLTGFSTYVFASRSVNQLFNNADPLVIGKLFSPVTLGFYSRAFSLNTLVNSNSVSSLSRVFFPVLSTVQDDAERFNNLYIRVIGMVAGVSVFVTGIMFLVGEELIIHLFGTQWTESVPIFRILIIKGLTYPVSAMIVNAFLAKGKSKENFVYGNIKRAVLIIPFVVAYFYGFQAYLYASVAAGFCTWLMNNYFVSRTMGIKFMKQFNAVAQYLFPGIAICMLVWFVFPQDVHIGWAIVRMLVFSALFILFLKVFNMELYAELLRLTKKVWQKLVG